MLVVFRNNKRMPKSLLTMMRLIWDLREWDVNNQDVFHIFVVRLKFLLQWRIYQQVFHTDPHVID